MKRVHYSLLKVRFGPQREEWEAIKRESFDDYNADYAESARKAAELGHARAQCDLGVIYSAGEGVPKDEAEAVKWFRKSAEQGYAMAQYFLGCSYRDGKGVSKDLEQAVNWLRKAAEQGYDQARKALKDMGKGE